MKNILKKLSENFHFLVVEFSVYLNRQVFVMLKYEDESIKNQPNLFLGEIDLFFFDVIAL